MRHLLPPMEPERGAAAIAAAIVLSAALVTAGIMTSDKIIESESISDDILRRDKLDTLNIASVEKISQLIQSGQLGIDANSGQIDSDSPSLRSSSGGYRLSLVGNGNNKVKMTLCDGESSASINDILNSNSTARNCPDKDKFDVTMAITNIRIIENVMPNGDRVNEAFAVFDVNTKSRNPGFKVSAERSRKARIRIPAQDGGLCPFTDPARNPPATASAFSVPMYIVVGRAFVGWARVPVPMTNNVKAANRPRSGGFASIAFDRELYSDPRCGSHECNYWAPSTATEDVRTFQVTIGDLNFGMQLRVPKDDPAGCYLAFNPNRRPKQSFNSGCFAEGTKIRMADMSLKRVELIEVGDEVYNPVTRSAQKVVRSLAGPEEEAMYKVTVGQRAVTVTSKHPFHTADGLKVAKNLTVGDEILARGGRYERVTGIDTVSVENRPFVYNFAVEGGAAQTDADHMVEADGLVTGDLYLQEKVSGIDPTKRPWTPQITQEHKTLITEAMKAGVLAR